MRNRSKAVIFASLFVLWGGCVDTVQPTEPVPTPPEDGGGELAPPAVSTDGGAQASPAQRRAGTQRN